MYIALLIVGVILSFIELIYVATREVSYYQVVLNLCLSSLIVWLIGYIVELECLAAGDWEAAIIGTRVSYIGKPFVPLTMYLCIAKFSRRNISKPTVIAMTGISAAVAVCAFTCTHHKLFYTSIGFDPVKNYLVLGHGPVYFVYMLGVFIYALANTILLVNNYKRAKTREDKRRALLLFCLIFFAVVTYILFLMGIGGGFDITVIGTILSVFTLFILFSYYHLFDDLVLAKDRLLNHLDDGFIVVDVNGHVEYANDTAHRLFPNVVNPKMQKSVLADLTRLVAQKEPIITDKLVYSVTEELSGGDRAFTIHDITERYNYAMRLQDSVNEKTEHIKEIQEKVVENFAALVEARDDVTSVHNVNASHYVRTLTDALIRRGICADSLTKDFTQTLVQVAPLHDIGKLNIPDSILKKPGKLTDAEFAEMRTHTTKGRKIVEDTFTGLETEAYIDMAEDVALYHHERWDGHGYPEGRAAEDIPISARIVAICDVYDALRSARPYKQAFSKEKALQIIKEGRGTQFDPVITDVFLEIANELD